MKFCKILLLSLLLLCFPIVILTAGGQKEQESQELSSQESTLENQILEILANYDADTLSEDDIMSIHEAFREQEIKGGLEIDEAIIAAGFDPDVLNNQRPPSSPDGNNDGPREPKDNKEGHSVQESVKIYEALSSEYGPSDFTLFSSAIENGEMLEEYQCTEDTKETEKSIPLNWDNVPLGTESLAIIMYHFPHPDDKTMANSYLLLWGIDPSVTEITYGGAISDEWYMGSNKDGISISYTAPCSPSPEPHEYCIAIFALSDYPEGLPEESSIDVDFTTFMDAIEQNNIIGKAELKFNVTRENI